MPTLLLVIFSSYYLFKIYTLGWTLPLFNTLTQTHDLLSFIIESSQLVDPFFGYYLDTPPLSTACFATLAGLSTVSKTTFSFWLMAELLKREVNVYFHTIAETLSWQLELSLLSYVDANTILKHFRYLKRTPLPYKQLLSQLPSRSVIFAEHLFTAIEELQNLYMDTYQKTLPMMEELREITAQRQICLIALHYIGQHREVKADYQKMIGSSGVKVAINVYYYLEKPETEAKDTIRVLRVSGNIIPS